MNPLKKVFIFNLFLFPLGEIFRFNFGNGIAIRPLDVGVGVLFLFWIGGKIINRQKLKHRYVIAPAILFFLSGFFSLAINISHLSLNEFLISLLYLLRWAAYAGLFFIISDFDKKFKKTVLTLLIAVGSLVVGLGYVQYFYYSKLQNLRYLGWDEHMFRMFSIFLDPNFAGAFFVLYFLFLANKFFEKKNILTGLLMILTTAAIFLTFSRSALIMFVISSTLLFILKDRKKWLLWPWTFILIVLVISSRNIGNANIDLFRVVSSEARLDTAKNALIIIKDNPILGVGFNSYRYAQFKYGLRSEVNLISHADAGTDNSFLFVLATTGIFGFVLYSFLWYRMLRIANALAVASIVGVFVDSMFINSLFYPFIMFWLWIILALRESKIS